MRYVQQWSSGLVKILILILVVIIPFAVLGAPEAASCKIWVQPSESIQAAIDAAPEGAVICLAKGIWKENLIISKSLVIRGIGREETVIEGASHGTPVLQIDSETEIIARVENLTIQSAKGGPRECVAVYPMALKTICPDGIAIQGSSKVFLLNLTVANNGRMGIYATDSSHLTTNGCNVLGSGRIGLFVRRYATATVNQTTIIDNNEGVMIADFAEASLTDCTIANSASYGVYVGGQPKCILTTCTVRGNGNNGIALGGNAYLSLIECTVTANKAWGIVKTSYPQPFTGTLDLDDESVLEGNEYPGIGSM